MQITTEIPDHVVEQILRHEDESVEEFVTKAVVLCQNGEIGPEVWADVEDELEKEFTTAAELARS